MVVKNLSYKWKKFEKSLLLFSTLLVNVIVFLFLVGYIIFRETINEEIVVFCTLSVILSSLLDYFLLIAKDVSFDKHYCYLGNEKISLHQIIKLKRWLYYYYKISYIVNNKSVSCYFFISFNPTLFRNDNIKNFLSHVKKNK